MPDVSIALSAKDKVSSILKKVGQISGETADEIDKLQDSLDTLSSAKVDLKTNLDKVRQQVSEARKEFRKLGDSVSEQNYKDKLSELEKLEQQYYAVSKSIRMVENEETSLAGTRSKLSNREAGGSSGSMLGTVGSALATAGFGDMLSNSLSGAAGAFFGSYYGTTDGAAIESFLGSAISGATMGATVGSMIGGPGLGTAIGAAAGGLIGAVSGGIEAATQKFESRDEAFKSYVQDRYNAVQERRNEELSGGSSIAGQREMDQMAFTTLFGNADTAQNYLEQVRVMGAETPFQYEDLTQISRTLTAFGYSVDELIPTMTALGDAGAANGMTTDAINEMAQALGYMRSSNLVYREQLGIFQRRGVDAAGAVAEAKGMSIDEVYSAITRGDLGGVEISEILTKYMEETYQGAMDIQSKTFEGLSSTLEDVNAELQNAMGEGYNEGKKIGMSDQIDWLEGEAGQKMMEMNEQLGRFKADAENLQQGIYQDVFNGMFTGEIPADMDAKIAAQVEDLHQRYMNAMATIESSVSSNEEVFAASEELATLKGAAEELAYNTYMTSDAADTMTAANIALADSIAASAGDAYENAGYSVSEKLTQGITRHINSYTPPPIKVPVLYESVSTSGGIAAGASARTSIGTSSGTITSSHLTGTTTGSHLTGATSPYRAIGENRVPRDNTLYLLHEGERVLTAREARAQDQGGTGGVNIYMGGNYTVRQDSDIGAIAEAVAARIMAQVRILR